MRVPKALYQAKVWCSNVKLKPVAPLSIVLELLDTHINLKLTKSKNRIKYLNKKAKTLEGLEVTEASLAPEALKKTKNLKGLTLESSRLLRVKRILITQERRLQRRKNRWFKANNLMTKEAIEIN